MKIEGDYLILSTGKRVYAFGNVIGLDINPERLRSRYRLHGGWDDDIHVIVDACDNWDDSSLSIPEALEITDLMIAEWTKYRNDISEKAGSE